MADKANVVFLGELASDENGSIAIGPFGSRMKAEVYVSSGVPVIRGTNISDGRWLKGDWVFVPEEFAKGLPNCLLRPGDLVFPHRGSIGEVAIVEESHGTMLLSSSMMKFRPDAGRADSGFLFYYFRSRRGRAEILKFASQVGTPGIGQPLTSLRQFKVPLPSLPEQKAIAHILGNLDDKIELNRRMNETLEAMARAIFKSWFVDFDPVRAKMDSRKPLGMDAATAALFPRRFEETTLGYTPEGWPVKPLPEVIEVNPNRTLPKGNVSPYLDMKNMPTRGHCPDEIIDRTFSSGTKFGNGDTLLARITPCLENGKTALVDFLRDGEVGWGSTEYIVFHPKPPLPAEFGYYLARSDDLRSFAIQNMTGTSGRQRVPPDCFNQYLLAVPPEPIARRFGDLVRPLVRHISASVMQSKTLAAARDALLPRLLSGELDVSQTGKSMKEVL